MKVFNFPLKNRKKLTIQQIRDKEAKLEEITAKFRKVKGY